MLCMVSFDIQFHFLFLCVLQKWASNFGVFSAVYKQDLFKGQQEGLKLPVVLY